MKAVRVILSPEAEEVYKKLNTEAENNKQSRRSYDKKFGYQGR
ncbi:MAG: hypothetical protein AABW67_06050 [Nanoarchaeota archaeon]